MNPGAPVFIPGGGGGHPVPPWPSPPSASVPPFPIPPSFSASIPTPLSSTNDSLHSFVTAIIFAYQQGVIAGSAISSPPSFLPTSIAPSTQTSARDSASTSSIPSIPYPTISVPPPSTIGMTISPSAHRISSPQIDRSSVRRIPGPVTPSLTTNKNTTAIGTPPHSLHSAPAPKRSSTIPSPLDYSIIINRLPIGLSGFPLIKPSRSSSLLPSTPFRALPPFTIRKDRRRNKRNGWRSSKRSSTIKYKQNNPRGEKKNNIPSPSSINHIPNRFSILASLDTATPLPNDHDIDHQTITISSPRAPTRSSTQLINDSPTSSTSRPSDLAHSSVDVVIADSFESNDPLIEAEIEEIVKPLIDGVCMNAVMNAEFIDLTGGDLYEWAECDAFINHPSRLPSPPPPDSPPSSYNTPLICHICSSEVFSCCPECLAPLCYPHFNPTDDRFASTNSTLPAHNCAAFILSVADDADRRQKEKNDDTNAVQKTQAATKNAKRKSKRKSKGSTATNPPPPSTPAPIPSPSLPAPPSLPSSIITRRILDDLIEQFNSCYNRIKPKKMKGELNRTIEKLVKAVDDHYDKLLYSDHDDIDNDKYDELAYNRDIPITLSSNLADALHSLQSHLASL